MPIQRFSHVGLCVSDLERSLAFYENVLGFERVGDLLVEGEAADTLLELPGTKLEAVYLERDGFRLELLHFAAPGHTGDGSLRPMNALGLTHLSLRVSDLAAILDELRAANLPVCEHTRCENPTFQADVVFVTDPDGTRIELLQMPGDPASLPGG